MVARGIKRVTDTKLPSDVTRSACYADRALLSALCSQVKIWTEAARDEQWTNTESTERSNVLLCFDESSSIKGMIVPLNRDHLLSFLKRCTDRSWPHEISVSPRPLAFHQKQNLFTSGCLSTIMTEDKLIQINEVPIHYNILVLNLPVPGI